MTRRCLYNRIEDADFPTRLFISGCNQECLKYGITYRFDGVDKDVIIKGNTQFYRNDKVFRNPERFNINRLVFMPKITL